MSHLAYLAVLGFVLVGSGWLEWGLRTRVLRRWRRLVLTLVPVVVVFAIWDAYAIDAGHWWFDTSRIVGVLAPGGIPVEELFFFVVVPTAAILTLEAVRSATGLPVGDEAPQATGGADPARGTDDAGPDQSGSSGPGWPGGSL